MKQKKKNYKKAFFRILKDIGCYHAFIKNFNKLDRYTKEFDALGNDLNKFINASINKRVSSSCSLFYYVLNDAFYWQETDEGFEYWEKISRILIANDRNVFSKYCLSTTDECIYNKVEIDNLKKLTQ